MMWGWGWGWVWMVGFWAVLVAVAIWVVTQVTSSRGPDHGGSRAEQILDERLARGEIDAEEHRRIREELDR